MSDPLILVVLLGSGGDPANETMLGVTRQALGPDAIVLVDSSDAKDDESALVIGEGVRARAVARVVWSNAAHEVARLRVHVAPSPEWVDEEIAFAPQDLATERARTVGYALASMVQRLERAQAAEIAPPPPPPPPAPPPPPPAAHAERPPPASDRAPRLDAVLGGIGARAGGWDLGASGTLRLWPFGFMTLPRTFDARRFGLHLTGGARTGSIAAANATQTTLLASTGPTFRPLVTRSLELGLRTSFVVSREIVSRTQDATTTRARWLGGVSAALELEWRLDARAAVSFGVGAELAFGVTAVAIDGVARAEIPAARPIGELGARYRF